MEADDIQPAYVIVGIDPGIKTGFAIIDLSGNLLGGGCQKEASDEGIIKAISGFGIPVLIASDTRPASSFVEKIAARLNVRVSSPSQSMTRIEKRGIGRSIDDPHMRDAYAAAVKAYRKHQNRLRQIDRMGLPPGEKDALKRMAIVGQRLSGRLLGKGQ
jgi:predicted RNase H-like nuclease (RuvC/YqgF family)